MKEFVNPSEGLCGTIELPPDKSISHRSAMFAALAEGESVITNFSEAADPQSTLHVLKKMGKGVTEYGTTVKIKGTGRDGFSTPELPLDCGNAGTLMRLLSGIVGGAGLKVTLTGDDSLRSRTMKRIIDPLQQMEVKIEAREDNYAPLIFKGTERITPITFALPIPSAQLKSCILLAGLYGQESTKVIEEIPSRDHTERMLQLPIEQKEDKKIISSSRSLSIPNQSIRVPGDFSAAAFWLVAGSIVPNSEIIMPGTGLNPTRTACLNILTEMGADISIEKEKDPASEPSGTISVRSNPLQAIRISPEVIPNCIDELPILAVAMLFAEGTSEISGAEELRHKETDRIKAMGEVFTAAGADFTERDDGFIIEGNPDFRPEPALYKSYDDHRVAMAAAILSLMSTGQSTIQNADCARISYPRFYKHLQQLGS